MPGSAAVPSGTGATADPAGAPPPGVESSGVPAAGTSVTTANGARVAVGPAAVAVPRAAAGGVHVGSVIRGVAVLDAGWSGA